MMKIIKYILFSFILTFILNFNVNAECSYQDRKQMLEEANNIEAFFDADLDNNKFVFYIYNLTDNLYLSLENSQTFEYKEIFKYMYNTNYYSLDELNVNDIIKYKLKIYANKEGCYGNIVTTKMIKKPMINKYYKEEICKGIEDYKYCVPVLDTKFNLKEEQIYNEIKKYKDSLNVSIDQTTINKFGLDDLIKIISEYWYIGIIIIMMIIVIYIIKNIIKKRGELK